MGHTSEKKRVNGGGGVCLKDKYPIFTAPTFRYRVRSVIDSRSTGRQKRRGPLLKQVTIWSSLSLFSV